MTSLGPHFLTAQPISRWVYQPSGDHPSIQVEWIPGDGPGLQVDMFNVTIEGVREAGAEKFTFKAWAEGKAWVDNYYVHVDYYLDVETGKIESAFRNTFENYDQSLRVTAVGTISEEGCTAKGEKLWLQVRPGARGISSSL